MALNISGRISGSGIRAGPFALLGTITSTLFRTLNSPNAYSTPVNDYFGSGVAIDGNYAIVGASREDATGDANQGKAYIYNVTTGALVFILDNPNAKVQARVTFSVEQLLLAVIMQLLAPMAKMMLQD